MIKKDLLGNTELHIAVISGDIQSVKNVLALHPELINEVNNIKETALHIAAWNQNVNMIDVLVDSGAKLEHTDAKNRDTLMILKALVKGSSDQEKNKTCELWLLNHENIQEEVSLAKKLKM